MPTRRQVLGGAGATLAAAVGVLFFFGDEPDEEPEPEPEPTPTPTPEPTPEPTETPEPAAIRYDASVERPEWMFLHDEIHVTLRVENLGEETGTYDYDLWLRRKESGPHGGRETYTGSLDPGESVSFERAIVARRRGEYQVRVDDTTVDSFVIRGGGRSDDDSDSDSDEETPDVDAGGTGSVEGEDATPDRNN